MAVVGSIIVLAVYRFTIGRTAAVWDVERMPAARRRSSSLGRSTMYDVRTRLDQDLQAAVSRLRQLGDAAVEERPRTIVDTCPFAEEIDGIQDSESREIGFATRELVLERVNRLSEALDRLNEGEYGTCVECDEPISLARLDAMPEVPTCVRCQDRLERLGQPRPVIY
jgi:DnaK suppressor protein